MDTLQKNIRFLRNKKGLTQQEFADMLKIKRSSIGAYEEGRARPSIEIQRDIAKIFGISLDQLLTKDLSRVSFSDLGKNLRVLSITVDKDDNENIELVSQKAAAGYLNGYGDPEFVERLPKFRLPFLPAGTYRAFEIIGDSMLPIQPGSIVIGEYLTDLQDVKDGQTYIVLTRQDGVVYKRLFRNPDKKLVLRSDNPSYPPIKVAQEDILEIWRSKLFITKAVHDDQMTLEKLMKMMIELKQDVVELKSAK